MITANPAYLDASIAALNKKYWRHGTMIVLGRVRSRFMGSLTILCGFRKEDA